MPAVDTLGHSTTRLRGGPVDLREDLALLRLGVLDFGSFLSGYRPHRNPVELRTTALIPDGAVVHPDLLVRDPKLFAEPVFDGRVWRDLAFDRRRRVLRQIRRQHNLNVDQGRNNLQRGQMFGDISANSTFATIKGQATASSATSLTNSGAAFPTSGGLNGSLQGHLVFVGPNSSGTGSQVYGVVLTNTATVLTVDQWYDPTSTSGAAGTTPNATGFYNVLASLGPMLWIGLSTDATTPAAADVLRTADGLFGTGTSGSASTEQTASGLARAYTQPTFPATHQTQLQHTWTYTGSSSVTIAKVVLCNSLAAAGSLLGFDTLLSATATVAQNGDSVQVTWTINN